MGLIVSKRISQTFLVVVGLVSAMQISSSYAGITVVRKEVTPSDEFLSKNDNKGLSKSAGASLVNDLPEFNSINKNSTTNIQPSLLVTQTKSFTPKPNVLNQFRLKNPPSYLGCFYSSSRKYSVPVDLMLAIAQTESSFQPKVKGTLGYGADHGLMQINDYWLPRLRKEFDISRSELYEPCTNIEVAAWILAHNYVQHGNWTDAVGAYNAVTKWKQKIYIRKVNVNLSKLYAGKL